MEHLVTIAHRIDGRSTSEAGELVSTRVRLGFLTHLHVGDDAADSYRIALELFETADALGYDSGWVAQHHFLNGGGRLPSSLTFLAAAAQRTRRIQLGTAIVILPLEDPIRLAEDAAVVDTLSGGRLHELEILDVLQAGAFFAWANRLMLTLGEPYVPR
jgi:hypothetical protein